MSKQSLDGLVSQRKQFLNFVASRVASRPIAEDILQAAYLRAIEQIAELRSDESAHAWFYRILRNAVIDHYRRRATEDHALEQWANELLIEPQPDPATQQAICTCVHTVLSALKPSYGQILRDVDLGELPLESFADRTGITPGNAAVRIHRARQALKKQLILTCRACAKHGCRDCSCT